MFTSYEESLPHPLSIGARGSAIGNLQPVRSRAPAASRAAGPARARISQKQDIVAFRTAGPGRIVQTQGVSDFVLGIGFCNCGVILNMR